MRYFVRASFHGLFFFFFFSSFLTIGRVDSGKRLIDQIDLCM